MNKIIYNYMAVQKERYTKQLLLYKAKKKSQMKIQPEIKQRKNFRRRNIVLEENTLS